MKTLTRFVAAELLWAGLVMLLIVPIAILSGGDGLHPVQIIRWLGHSLALAALPAGIMVAPEIEKQPRQVWPLLAVVTLAAFMVWALLGIVSASVSPDGDPDFFRILAAMRATDGDWFRHNRYAWLFGMTLTETLSTFLFAGIGVQLGIWAPRALPVALRRTLYWAVAFGLLLFTFVSTDAVYEKIVVHAAGPVDFIGFIGLILPAGMFAGLLLPSLSVLRQPTP